MTYRTVGLVLFGLVVAILIALTLWPTLDIAFSALFVAPDGGGFVFKDNLFLNGMTKTVFYAARVMAVVFILAGFVALLRKTKIARLDAKAWGFLFLCLLIGPGLLANVLFKDHWGRARPRDADVFGGAKPFTPAFVVSDACDRNCSFVSGDASYGFFLPAFAYLAAPARRRRLFWGMMALGAVIASARVLLGAHFLSDTLAAMFIVLGVSAGLHALFYGRGETKRCWRDFMGS